MIYRAASPDFGDAAGENGIFGGKRNMIAQTKTNHEGAKPRNIAKKKAEKWSVNVETTIRCVGTNYLLRQFTQVLAPRQAFEGVKKPAKERFFVEHGGVVFRWVVIAGVWIGFSFSRAPD